MDFQAYHTALVHCYCIFGMNDNHVFRILFQAHSLDSKHNWVTKIRQLINERILYKSKYHEPMTRPLFSKQSGLRKSGRSQTSSSDRNSKYVSQATLYYYKLHRLG